MDFTWVPTLETYFGKLKLLETKFFVHTVYTEVLSTFLLIEISIYQFVRYYMDFI